MAERQLTTPLVVEDGEAIRLERIPFGEKRYPESWLQQLLFENPDLLPVEEIEPVFSDLMPVARELPTGAGPIDLVLINRDGLLALVETKLWRNPDARRSVVAQIIDYAKDMSEWTYEMLREAVRSATKATDADPLAALMREEDDEFDEKKFVDQVGRGLRLGRFLLLIVGDGIREGVEQMADFLQRTPSLGYTLGLVEIGLFRKPKDASGPIFVQPRILARTVEVERAVVTVKVPIDPKAIEVSLPEAGRGTSDGRQPITEQEFLRQLSENSEPAAVEFAKAMLDGAEDHRLQLRWQDAGPTFKYVHPDTGHEFTLAQLNRRGTLTSTPRLVQSLRKAGVKGKDIGNIYGQYIAELAEVIPGASVRVADSGAMKKRGAKVLLMEDGSHPPLSLLAPHKDKLFAAIDHVVGRIDESLD